MLEFHDDCLYNMLEINGGDVILGYSIIILIGVITRRITTFEE